MIGPSTRRRHKVQQTIFSQAYHPFLLLSEPRYHAIRDRPVPVYRRDYKDALHDR